MRILKKLIALELIDVIFGYDSSYDDIYALQDNDVFNIWEYNECNNIVRAKAKPRDDAPSLMRKIYEELMEISEPICETSCVDFNGFKIEYYVNYNDKTNNLGVFANEKIRRHQVVYEHNLLGDFPDSKSFVNFLNHLPADLVCNAIEWGYFFESINEDHGWITIDLDDMVYVRGEGEGNINYSDKDLQIIALRDIEKGEELMFSEYDSDITASNFPPNRDILWDLNKCDEIMQTKRPVFNKELWTLMEKKYEEVTNEIFEGNNSGFKVKYSVKQTERNGRNGLFTRQKIKKGQLVYEHTQTAFFPDTESFNNFQNSLVFIEHERTIKHDLEFLNHFPSGLICEIDIWAYFVEYSESLDDGLWERAIDFDDISYCYGNDYYANLGYNDYDNKGKYVYALRDINAGEELICSHIWVYESTPYSEIANLLY